MSFSYFKKGIEDTIPTCKISIEKLIKEIKKENPEIEKIRQLDICDPRYAEKKKAFKEKLHYITPNAVVTKRKDNCITSFSNYMYFDVDEVEDVKALKQKLIASHGNDISMLCLSSSGRGLSILVKIENEVTKENFKLIWEYIDAHIFTDVRLDPKPKAPANAWYISYDPECYFSPSAVIDIPEEYLEMIVIKESATCNIITPPTDILQVAPFIKRNNSEIDSFTKLKFKTDVAIQNSIFDFKPIGYCEVFLPQDYRIPKGRKQAVFSTIIHNLVYLNPGLVSSYIYDYIRWMNQNKTIPGTEATKEDLLRFVKMVYAKINDGCFTPTIRTKYFHCRSNVIPSAERKLIGRRMHAMYSKFLSIEIVQTAKQIILLQKSATDNIITPLPDILPVALSEQKVTQQEVLELIKERSKMIGIKPIGIRTIKTYWNKPQFDFDEMVQRENDRLVTMYSQCSNKQ
jgi:hypothetical protein